MIPGNNLTSGLIIFKKGEISLFSNQITCRLKQSDRTNQFVTKYHGKIFDKQNKQKENMKMYAKTSKKKMSTEC